VDHSRRYTRILLILFLCTLPLVNPIVHGDGVGYYAYARAPLIEQNLDSTEDYRYADPRAISAWMSQGKRFGLKSKCKCGQSRKRGSSGLI